MLLKLLTARGPRPRARRTDPCGDADTMRLTAAMLCCSVAHVATVSALQPDGHAQHASASAARRPPPASLSPILSRIDVFGAGDGGCAAFRVPALVAAGHDVLLAFAECRKWTCNDYGRHDLVMRRSTNSGSSFGELTTLLEPNSFWTDCNHTELSGVPNLSEGGICYGGCAVWDPTALADSTTGTIWLWFGRSNSSCPGSRLGGRRVDLWALKSTDRGLSFSHPMDMTAQCSTPYGGGITTAGGHGIQLHGAPTPSASMLIVPLYGCGGDGGQGLCTSTDGITWNAAGGTTPPTIGMNGRASVAAEGEVVELFGKTQAGLPRLLYNTRPVGAARCTTNRSDYDVNHQCRLMYISDTLGHSWSRGVYHPELPDPSCKGGVVRWDREPQENGSIGVLFAIGATSSKYAGGVRTNTTLSWSTDDGVSFARHLQLDPSGGYATVQITSARNVAIAALYEAPSLHSYNCWAPCGQARNSTNNSTNCCTMSHYYQPPGCPTDSHGTTLPNCTWLLDCSCNPVGCGIKLAVVDPMQLDGVLSSATGKSHKLKTDEANGHFPAAITHDVPLVWPPAHQCYRSGASGDSGSNHTKDCQPGWEQCQPHAWGPNSPQYHVRDRSCLVGDPNEPVWDPKHKLYHLFYQVGSGRFPGSPVSGKWWPRGSLIQGPIQGHVASRDLVRWSQLPIALWNDQPFDSVAVYTGSATVVNGTVQIVYPGVCDGHRRDASGRPTIPDPIWPTCSDDGAYHYNLVWARPSSPTDPLLVNWTKQLIANNTQRDPSSAWQNSDGQWRLLTWDQVLFASSDFKTFQKLSQPAGLAVGDCPSLFELPGSVANPTFNPPVDNPERPDHVHKISYNNQDWYSLGQYIDGHGLAPGAWQSTGQPPRRLDSGAVYASKDFNDTVHNRRIIWGHVSTGPDTGNCFTLPRRVTYDDELQQLIFEPLPEQEQLRGKTLGTIGRTELIPGVPMALDSGWHDVDAIKQAEVSIEIGLPKCRCSLALNISGLVVYYLDYVPPSIGVSHVATVSATCANGCGPGVHTNETLQLKPSDTSLSLRVFTDHWLSELYWQGGRVTTTLPAQLGVQSDGTTPLLTLTASSVEVRGNPAPCTVVLRHLQAWAINSIWVENSELFAQSHTQVQRP